MLDHGILNEVKNVWAIKYRPTNIDQIILPINIKTQLEFIHDNRVSNLLFHGRAGTGKTSTALIIANLGYDMMYLNCSNNTSIDDIRDKVLRFVNTTSIDEKNKLVILDEFERLSPQAMDMLKVVLEEYSHISSFIFITNSLGKVSEPIRSRMQLINFNEIPDTEASELKKQFFIFCCKMLKQENVEFDKNIVKKVVISKFPDYRRTITELQRLHQQNSLVQETTNIDKLKDDEETLHSLLKSKYHFENIRRFAERFNESETFYRYLFNNIDKWTTEQHLPIAILIIGKYYYESNIVIDCTINIASCITELFQQCEFK